HTVCLTTVDGHRCHVCDGQRVKPTGGRSYKRTGRRLNEVVSVSGLVVNFGYPAKRSGTKVVLGRSISISTCIVAFRLNHANVHGLAIGIALHLIERAIVG